MNTRQAISDRNQSIEPKLLCANFNQNQDCFAIGHENGFRVYSTDPMVLRVKRTFSKSSSDQRKTISSNSNNNSKEYRAGIGHISMLHRTNFLSLVGGGKNPKFPLNKVIIYDDLKKKNTLSLEFMSPILNVFLSRIRIIIVVETHIYVYAFSSPPRQIATYETISNPHGIADLSNSLSHSTSISSSTTNTNNANNNANALTTTTISSSIGNATSSSGTSTGFGSHVNEILAFPSRQPGQIQIVDISPIGQERNLVSIIKAHKSRIRCIALNQEGTMVASASETGTIIRVHSVINCTLLYEFRRGLDKAIVYSMKFSPNGSKLAVLSDKQTLHVFKLFNHDSSSSSSVSSASPKKSSKSGIDHHNHLNKHANSRSNSNAPKHNDNINRQHFLKKMPIFTNYFNSQWSFVSCHLNQPNVLSQASLQGSPSSSSTANHMNNSLKSSELLNKNLTGNSGNNKLSNNSNNDKYIEDLNTNSKINDRGVLGWSGENSIILIWKFRGKWEKYVIIKNKSHGDFNQGQSGRGVNGVAMGDGNYTNHDTIGNGGAVSGKADSNEGQWQLVREGWRSFGNLTE